MPTRRRLGHVPSRGAMLVVGFAVAVSAGDRVSLPPEPASSDSPATRPARPRRSTVRRVRLDDGLKAGQDAPDIELHRLVKVATSARGVSTAAVSDETVRLSSFKGARPVCLIFSSYT